MTTEATDGIEPIIVGIKRDTREILDIFASGGTSSSRPGEYAASPGPQTDIVITVKLDDTTGRNFVETNGQGSSGEGRVQIVSSPAPVAVSSPVVSSHAPVAVSSPVVSSPAPVAVSSPIVSSHAPVAVSSPIVSSPAPVAVSSPVVSSHAPVAVSSPIVSSPAPVAVSSPIVSSPAPVAVSSPVVSSPAPVAVSSPVVSSPAPVAPSIQRNRDANGRFIRATSEVATAVEASDAAAEQRNQQLIAAISTSGEGRITRRPHRRSAGQLAHDQATSGGEATSGTDARPQTFVDRMKNAGVAATKNTDMAETVGLATLGGPITGIISELVGIGSQIKDTFTGVVNKFRGLRGNRGTGDRSVDAQIRATSEVTTAVQASDTAAEQRNQQLIGAISTLGESRAAEPSQSAGQQAHHEATHGGTTATTAAGAAGAGGHDGTDRPGSQPSSGGILSRVRDNITDRVASSLPVAPLATTVATVAGTVLAAFGITSWLKGAEKDFNDTKGQADAFGLEDGKQANLIEKLLYAVIGFKTEEQQKKEEGQPTGILAMALKANQLAITAAFEMAEALNLPKIEKIETKVGSVNESSLSPGTMPAQTATASTVATSSPGTPAPAQTAIATPVAASKKKKGGGGGKKDDYEYTGMGSLAAYHESRGDVGAVAPDVKGFAYGKFQMHSKGTVGDFIKQSPWAKDFEGMKPGSKEYNEQWPKTAAKNPEAFGAAQFDFIKKTHYGPTEKKAKKMGIDTTDPMLQEVLLSTGTQHGPKGGPAILEQAFKDVDPKTLSREQIRERVYAERGRKNADGTLAHFPSLEGGIAAHNKQGQRFVAENKNAAKIGALSSPEVASAIGQPIDQSMVPAAPTAPVQTATASHVSVPASETTAPVQAVTTSPVPAPAPEAAPVQTAATTGTQKAKGEPSIFAQAMKGVDPRTLTSEQRRDMYFAEKNRKDANGNLVHPLKAKGNDAQISQPIDEATSQPAAIQQPAPIASSQQTQPPAPVPIVQPKPEPQPVVIANSGGSSGGSSASGGQQGGFQQPQTNRRDPPQRQSQTQKQPSIIPFEFDDIMLTLMTHDLM